MLVHKVAGHVAQQGGTLDEVRRAAEDAVERLASMGTALTACTVPTASGGDRQPLSEVTGTARCCLDLCWLFGGTCGGSKREAV